jgi:hypothetical protein
LSFWGDERNFLEPLMRFTSGDVRDHIVSSKIDQSVVALKSNTAAEKSKDQLSQDFPDCSIFDFCDNTTGGDHKRIDLARAFELAGRSLMGAMGWRLTARTIP